jgi:hypothetical protein
MPTLEEAMRSPDWPLWREAMANELRQLGDTKKTWKKVKRESMPDGYTPIGCRWVLVIKTKPGNGKDEPRVIDRYKARLVAQGFTQ